MAVYERIYRGYFGALTGSLHRPLVITRYALADLFDSRLFLAFFLVCLLPSVVFMLALYLAYNVEALTQFQISPGDLFKVDAGFFAQFLQRPVAALSFVMILMVGPALVSPDLRNNAMPLYLSRPLSKADYVMGKLLTLVVLVSAITWIPGILLFIFQAYLAEEGWLLANLRVPFAMIVSSLVWTLCLSVISLAISAWVKWKAIARLMFLGLIFLTSSIGGVMQQFGGWRSSIINFFEAHELMSTGLYGVSTHGATMTWIVLGWFAALTILATSLLLRRVRAHEVVV